MTAFYRQQKGLSVKNIRNDENSSDAIAVIETSKTKSTKNSADMNSLIPFSQNHNSDTLSEFLNTNDDDYEETYPSFVNTLIDL